MDMPSIIINFIYIYNYWAGFYAFLFHRTPEFLSELFFSRLSRGYQSCDCREAAKPWLPEPSQRSSRSRGVSWNNIIVRVSRQGATAAFFSTPVDKHFRLCTSKIFRNYYVMLNFAVNKNPFPHIAILLTAIF